MHPVHAQKYPCSAFNIVMNAKGFAVVLSHNHISGQIKGTIKPYSLYQNDHITCFKVSSLRAFTMNVSFKGQLQARFKFQVVLLQRQAKD